MDMADRPSLASVSAMESTDFGCPGTYSFEVIDFAHAAHGFCSFDNRDGLDRDAVAEAGTFAIYDTWDEDISLYTVLFTSFDDLVVGTDGLGPPH